MNPDVSVIISTYNQPEWLTKVLFGYEIQSYKNFEIVIADDGSDVETKTLVDDFIADSNLKITHVWQEDEGFQKTKILNKAILKTKAEYLIFTDGDCIPRADFVETHMKLRKASCLLSGGYFKLPLDISNQITKTVIIQQQCFSKKWLLSNGLETSFKTNKLTATGFKGKLLNKFTPTKATFDGMNTSAWKQDILDVNGFDERMHYGGEDRELGERMMNNGIKPIQVRYSAICVHLDHERGYIDDVDLQKNKNIRKTTKKERKTWTNFGLKIN